MGFFKSLGRGLASVGSKLLGKVPGFGEYLQAGFDSLVGDLYRGSEVSDAYDRQLAYQRSLMQSQFDNQVKLFDMQQDATNRSLINQYAQYRELGVNPLSINGSVVSAPLPSASSGGASFDPSHLAMLSQQESMMRSQQDLMASEAEKNRAEANAIDPDEASSRTFLNLSSAERIKALLNGEVELQDANISLMTSMKYLNERQISFVDAKISEIQSSIDQINANIGLLREETRVRKLTADTFVDNLRMNWDKIRSDIQRNSNLNYNDTRRVTGELHNWMVQNRYTLASLPLLHSQTRIVANEAFQSDVNKGMVLNNLPVLQNLYTKDLLFKFKILENGRIRLDVDNANAKNYLDNKDWFNTWNTIGAVTHGLGISLNAGFNLSRSFNTSDSRSTGDYRTHTSFDKPSFAPVRGFAQ